MDSFDKIDRIITLRGLSGSDLERMIGASNSAYSNWRKRKNKISNKSLKKIADALEISVSEILPDEEPEAQTEPDVPKQTITEDQMKAAFWHGETVLDSNDIDELWEDVRAYVDLQTHLRKKKKIERNGTL